MSIQHKQIRLEEVAEHLGFNMFALKQVIVAGSLYFIDGITLTVLFILSFSPHSTKVPSYVLFACGQVSTGIGGLYWGWMSDKRGRHRLPIISCALLLYFGILDVVEDEWMWTCALRCVTGFCAGVSVVAPCYAVEVTSRRWRSKMVVLIQVLYGVGVLLISLVALCLENSTSKHTFLILVLVPLPVCMIALARLPETFQYMKHNEDFGALLKTLQRISVENKKIFPVEGAEIECHHARRLRGKVSILFTSRYILKMIVMMVVSFTAYFCYFNALLYHADAVHTYILRDDQKHEENVNKCQFFSGSSHNEVLVYGGLVDTFAPLLLLPLSHIVGRKNAVIGLNGCNILVYISSAYIHTSSSYYFIFALLFRAIASLLVTTTTLYTVELFPTLVRACAVGLCCYSARVWGVVAASYAYHGVDKFSTIAILMCCIGLSLLSMLLVALLPETRGKYLDDNFYR